MQASLMMRHAAMFTFASRALPAMVVVALASFTSSLARAEQAVHVHLQELTPLREEAFSPLDGQRQDNEFGASVVIRDGLAFIGMPAAMTTGQVAVFAQGTTGWVRTATIVASDRTTDDGFGQAISFRDGLLVVGSTRAAYVYKRVNGVWRERQKIVPPAADGVDTFRGLEHEAGVLAIAAFSSGNIGLRDSVYVFEQDANGRFVRRARLMPFTDSSAGFGNAIGMTKRIIVIGSFAGSAYVFGRNGSGKWVQRQKLIASSRTNTHDGYGLAVAVDNGMILVGAPYAAFSGDTDQIGEVYVFLPGATQYVEAFKLQPRIDMAGGWRFGSALAISDKYIAVGSSEIPSAEDNPPGSVSTYLRDGSSVRSLGVVDYRDTRPTVTRFPTSIDIANNLLLVGSAFDESCSAFDDLCEPTGINIGEANLFRLNQFKP
jgi:hypothetical protein